MQNLPSIYAVLPSACRLPAARWRSDVAERERPPPRETDSSATKATEPCRREDSRNCEKQEPTRPEGPPSHQTSTCARRRGDLGLLSYLLRNNS